MSARNRRDEKKLRKLSKALRKGRLPAYIDLVQWLVDYGHAQTKGAARKLIHERRVMSESHPLGFRVVETDDEKHEVYDPFVPAKLRSSIAVTRQLES